MALTNEALQQQLIKDLIIESADGLDRLDRELLALENGSGGPDSLNIIFRVVHTIKGTAGCIGLTPIETVAHVGENVLSLLRDGKIEVTQGIITVLLEYSDALKEMLRTLEATGTPGDKDYGALLARLQDFQNGGTKPEQKVSEQQGWGLFDDDAETVKPDSSIPSPPVPVAANPAAATEADVATPKHGTSIADTAIRVDVSQLDKLMNLVGELVLARNQIVQYTSESKEAGLLNASQRLNIITTELQESVMKTRMQPIDNIWSKYPRIIRDIAKELGKKVQLVMEGNDTELDRTIIEAIKDPLIHIIRNAIDHGLELPDARRAAGKPEEGMLVLRAFHEGGQVNIEIMDDGAGINISRVKKKAIEKGLVTAEQAGRLSDREVFGLVFLPGFSTAEKITNVSGRGVGMDVVKTNIEKIGGSVDIFSEAGQGTTLKIKIPLTLAIIPALIVTSGGERFAIPQVSLLELVRLEGDHAQQSIEMLYGLPVYRLRGQLLPLVYLNRELQLECSNTTHNGDAVHIVVLQADGRQFGMIVDEINDTEEIVVKPLSKQLKGIACFAGATIMGDGKVALILDVLGIAQHSNVISEVRDRAHTDKNKAVERNEDRQTLLLFDVGRDTRMAIPLSVVARLEEFPKDAVERSGGQEVIQYRGQILPLIDVSQHVFTGGGKAEIMDPMHVVVYSEHGRSIGLVVSKISDIVEESLTIKRDKKGQGIVGSAVIQERVTDLLDVAGLIQLADPNFYEAMPVKEEQS